jgi:AbrB family looped-hinge helix DNA binding protein
MVVGIIKMSSKGQVVIPREIRVALNMDEGSVFTISSNQDSVILKKMKVPSEKDLVDEIESWTDDLQLEKMTEIWDNEADEVWENV